MVKSLSRIVLTVLLLPVLALGQSLSGIVSLVPEGYRALTIRVSKETAMASYVNGGLCVDVVLLDQPNQKHHPHIIRNLPILAVVRNLAQPWSTITLLVSPQIAEAIVLSAWPGESLRLLPTPPVFLSPIGASDALQMADRIERELCWYRAVDWKNAMYGAEDVFLKRRCNNLILDPFSLAHP